MTDTSLYVYTAVDNRHDTTEENNVDHNILTISTRKLLDETGLTAVTHNHFILNDAWFYVAVALYNRRFPLRGDYTGLVAIHSIMDEIIYAIVDTIDQKEIEEKSRLSIAGFFRKHHELVKKNAYLRSYEEVERLADFLRSYKKELLAKVGTSDIPVRLTLVCDIYLD
jgi:hypothetical protein